MYDVLLISYGANGCLSTLFSYFIYLFQDQMCVSVRVYMCVRGHARAYMFCIWGVMAYIGRVQRMRQVYFSCAYCADKFASKIHHLYPLFLFVNTIKGTVLRRTKLRNMLQSNEHVNYVRCPLAGPWGAIRA